MCVVGSIHPQMAAPRSRRDNRAAILLAGRRLFARHGLAGVTFEDIARETGLTRRTIYNHFANIEDLFAASIRVTLEQLHAQMPAALAIEQPLGPALHRFVRELLALFTDTRFADVHLALVRHGAEHPALHRAFERQLLEPLHTRFAAYLQARRILDGTADPRPIAREVVAVVLGLAETARLLGRSGEDAIARALPLAAMIAHALIQPEQPRVVRVA